MYSRCSRMTNPFPPTKKTVPPQIINPPEVFIIRGSFLANVLKTKISKPIKHKKHLKSNEIANSYNNFLDFLYKVLMKKPIKRFQKTLIKINEIPNSYNNFLDFLYKFLIKNLLKD